jgi:hypothetical protein
MKFLFSNRPRFISLVCIFAIATLLCGWIFYCKTHPTFNYEVLYTPDGFVPSYIDIPIGSKVAFRNTTNIPLWPASDPYGTYADYPEFDSKKDYHHSETFAFQFNQGGTFGYHNEERPVDNAIIPVPDISKTFQKQLATRDKLIAMLIPNKPDSIFKVIDAIESDKDLALDCHEIGHDLGHDAYDLYGFSSALTYSNPKRLDHASAMDICAGGYIHGILEEASLNDANFRNQPGRFCTSVPVANQDSCYHGVGHALMFLTLRNIPDSLEKCRSLATADEASRCFEGVWMETFWGSTEHAGPHTLGWDLDKPLEPCIETGDDAKPACFIYSPFGYLRSHPKDYEGVVNLCTQDSLSDSLSENDEKFCLKGVGIAIISHLRAQNLEQSEHFVSSLDYAKKYDFYGGVIGYAKLSGISEKELSATCASLQNDKDVCADALAHSQ